MRLINMRHSQNIFGKNTHEYAILRHGNAKGKWYALIGKISKTKLGLKEQGETDFINLKCPPDMVSILETIT